MTTEDIVSLREGMREMSRDLGLVAIDVAVLKTEMVGLKQQCLHHAQTSATVRAAWIASIGAVVVALLGAML